MLPKEFVQTKKEFSTIEQNIWIREYVSRCQNPIMLILYFLSESIVSFISFEKYFTTGSHYSIWLHIVVLVSLLIVFGIIHSILNFIFKRVAMQHCPVVSSSNDIDMELYDDTHAYLAETDAMLTEYNRLKGLNYPGLDLSFYPLLSPAILILCFGYFAWIQQFPIPQGCVFYLVVLCIVFVIYGCLLVSLSSQSVGIPLSYEVKESLEKLEQFREKRKKETHTKSDASSDVGWYVHQQKEHEDYEKRLHDWATGDDDPTPGCGNGI